MQHPSRQPGRRAFTLVELLVVIAIIGVLASLTTVAVFAVIGSRTRANTQTTMLVIHKMLQDRWAAVIADARKETPSPAAFMVAGGDPERARVIWIKARLMEAFPTRYVEVNGTLPASVVLTFIPANRLKPHFAKYRQAIGTLPGGTGGESSACLLLALNTLQAGDTLLDDQLKYAVTDTDGDGLKELVDGWGKPFAFYRFPWNNPALQAANPGSGNVKTATYADPIDTGGSLINKMWYNAPILLPAPFGQTPRLAFETRFHPVGPTPPPMPAGSGPPSAYYTTPVIVSAGPDGIMDLAADMSASGLGATDNMFSFQLRGD